MGDLLVDPHMISTRAHMTQEEASIFLERPIHWVRAGRTTGCRLVISDSYLSALCVEGQYPTPDRLNEIYRIARSEHFDAGTVFRAFEQILDIAPRVERIIGITDVLIDESETYVVPATILERLSPKVIEALVDILAACALYTAMTGVNYPFALATEFFPRGSKQDMEGQFLVLDFAESSSATITFPLGVILKLPLLTDAEDVFEILDFDSVCHDAECAIQWSRVHAIPRQHRAKHLMSEFAIREEFKQRVSTLGLSDSMLKQVYRKIVYLLCGLHSAGLQIEPLRIDRGPNSVQYRRPKDGAYAFRMQISQHRGGYHVHYWRRSGGLIEVAWVGPHNDFYIPE